MLQGKAGAKQDAHLSARAYTVLAIVFGLVGLTASGVTAQFFIVGLLKLEADALARDALIAAGVLMIVAEVLAFGIASLLPRNQLASLRRQLIAFGLALLAFEGVTIYVTQVALAQTASADAQASSTRIESLRSSIEGQRKSAAALRENAERQGASQHSWVRADGAKSLKEAIAIDAGIARQAQELASLEVVQRPTLAGILGQQGLVIYSVARALLISTVGIMMCAAAGALLRARRSIVAVPAVAPATVADLIHDSLPKATVTAQAQKLFFGGSGYRSVVLAPITATLSVPAISVARPAADMPAAKAPVPASTAAATLHPETKPEAPKQQRAAMQDSGVGADDGTRFLRVREGILSGEIKPSLRAIWKAVRASQRVAERYLETMEKQGEIVRSARGYTLAASQSGLDTTIEAKT
jgi:hypothetical protein